MRRVVIIVVLVAVAIAAATIADHPGSVDITWQSWEITTSVDVLAAALAVAAGLLGFLFALGSGALRLPSRFRRNRHDRRRRTGEVAITHGLAALAAGDPVAARRYAGRAEALLPRSPLTLLLAAQAAQLAGDERGAGQRYAQLLDGKHGAFLGLRGLIGQAVRLGDSDEALRLARQAQAQRPNAPWVFETLLALEVGSGRWEAARDLLDNAARRHLLPEDRAAHHRAAVLHELSLAAETAGDRRRALSLAASASEYAADFVPAAVHRARMLIADGRQRAARRLVERTWQRVPHPELARVWAELGGAMPALELVTWFERLAALNPEASESHIAVAEAALAAQLWGEARRHLHAAIGDAAERPPRRLCLLMARLEEGEHPGSDMVRSWLERATGALPDPAYVCAACGDTSEVWRARCANCGGFDTLAWRPARTQVAIAPPPAPELLPPLSPVSRPAITGRQPLTEQAKG